MSGEKTASREPGLPDGISFMVSASNMRASVELDLEHAEDWSPERVREYITSEGVVYGTDEQAITAIFDKKTFNQMVVVAKGSPAKKGEDGSIRYHIDVHCLRGRPRVLETGRVDHRDLGLFQAVEQGQLLTERIAPTPGVPGRDVYGNEIPAIDGKEAKLTGGKNTKVSEDGNQLVAATDGCLTGTPEKIEVTPTLTVSGDLDYKTGNIASNVAVIVSGAVLPDFSIKSDADVNIVGLVDAAEISSGGRIAINAGIQGGGKAVLSAEKEILARFANEATLRAKGDIVVQGPVTHCHIEAQAHLIVEGGKGIILGGRIHADHGVTADAIGSEMGVKTLIIVGPQLRELNERISSLEEKRNSLVPNVARLRQLLQVLAKINEKKGGLPPDKQALAVRVKKTFDDLTEDIKQIETTMQQLIAKRGEKTQVHRTVNVKGTTWPGTQIRILDKVFAPKTPMKGCTFTIIDNEIQTFAYRAPGETKEKEKEQGQS